MTQCMQPVRAVEEGFLPGRGVALLRAVKALGKLKGGTRISDTGSRSSGRPWVGRPPDRHQFRRGRVGRDQRDTRSGDLRLRLRRPDRRIRQSGDQGHYRPDQGGSNGLAGCRVNRGPADHDGGNGRRAASKDNGAAWPPAPAPWGRHRLLSGAAVAQPTQVKERSVNTDRQVTSAH